jgi:hypothetical protein
VTTVRADNRLLHPPIGTALAQRQGAIAGLWLGVIALALAAGIVFRLMLPGDIEFHGDEKFSFDHVMTVLNGGPWPTRGMVMSIGGWNAGMSVWVFVVLGLLVRPETPPDLAHAVQLLNIAALIAFLAFVVSAIPRRQREPWLWALALWAVNPLAVIYERKIWPPSVLPIFFVAMLFGWWYRRHWLGSFLFALVAILAGQIHPTAAFFGAAVLGWTLFDDRRAFRVSGLIAGAALGGLPALSWITEYLGDANKLHKLGPPWLSFYGQWFTEPFGFGADYMLGPMEFPRFLGWPELAGRPTYVVLILHVVLGGLAIGLLASAAVRLYRSGMFRDRWLLLGETAGGRLVRAAFFGFGTMLTLLTVRGGGLYPHYLIVIAPVMTLWVALTAAFAEGGTLAIRGRALLSALCVCDALIVLLLFSYIDMKGDIHGEFGPSWAWRQTQPMPLFLIEPKE